MASNNPQYRAAMPVDLQAVERAAAEQAIRERQSEQAKQPRDPLTAMAAKIDTSILGDLTKLGGFIAGDIQNFVATISHMHGPEALSHMVTLMGGALKHAHHVTDPLGVKATQAMEDIGQPFIDSLLGGSMGIELSHADKQNLKAVRTLYRVAGFTIAFQYGTAAIVSGSRFLFKERIPETLIESIGKMGEELGLNWMMGTLLETTFEQAVGAPLEEIINKQVHPARLGWRELKTLAKQGVIKPDEFKDQISGIGYSGKAADWLLKLDQRQLSMSDLQQAYINGTLKEDAVKGYLKGQGWGDADIKVLLSNYLHHAETQAGATMRSAARSALMEQHITEAQFGSILASLGTPERSIKIEVAAVNLLREDRTHQLSVANLKAMFLANEVDWSYVHDTLKKQNYSEEALTRLHALWTHNKEKGNKHLSAGKILAYQIAKVLTPLESYNELIKMGYDSRWATLMVNNPSTKAGHVPLPYKPSTIVSAYKDGLLDPTTAQLRLAAAGLSRTEAHQLIANAAVELKPHRGHPAPRKYLNESQLSHALAQGLMNDTAVIDYLTMTGYTDHDARVLYGIMVKLDATQFPGGGIGTGSSGPPGDRGLGDAGATIPEPNWPPDSSWPTPPPFLPPPGQTPPPDTLPPVTLPEAPQPPPGPIPGQPQ